jgi:hypothetical protein
MIGNTVNPHSAIALRHRTPIKEVFLLKKFLEEKLNEVEERSLLKNTSERE